VFISYQHIQPECVSRLVGTDKYHIQVSHHLRVGKNALNEYDQYVIYLAILYHGVIDMFSVCSKSSYSKSNSM